MKLKVMKMYKRLIFWIYFKYHSPSFLAKDLVKAKNNILVSNINDALINLRNAIIIRTILGNENLDKNS